MSVVTNKEVNLYQLGIEMAHDGGFSMTETASGERIIVAFGVDDSVLEDALVGHSADPSVVCPTSPQLSSPDPVSYVASIMAERITEQINAAPDSFSGIKGAIVAGLELARAELSGEA